MTWEEYGMQVAQFSAALQGLGKPQGSRIAIFSNNCLEWYISDFAALAAGLVVVPLYPNATEEQARYIIEHSECEIVIVRGRERFEKIKNISIVKKIIYVADDSYDLVFNDQLAPSKLPEIIPFDSILESGMNSQSPKNLYIADSDLATIVYTSGTTATPKGVMISHKNLCAQLTQLTHRSPRSPDDHVLSYLPLSHIAERINGFRQALIGYQVYVVENINDVMRAAKSVRPTVFFGVPRIWEKLQDEFKDDLKYPKLLFGWFAGRNLKKKAGLDRCRLFYTGSAPISQNTLRFFYDRGMTILQVYGLTECTGASHMTLASHYTFNSVGPVLDQMECRLSSDGEIQLKGDNICLGYYKDPQSTSELKDGPWLRTGDIGAVEIGAIGKKGNLRIVDRKKNIIITSGGKNVSPAPLEAQIRSHPLVNQAVVIGDTKKCLITLVTLNRPTSPDVRREMKKHIDGINSKLAKYETIKEFIILDREFAVESGELTPTLKVKRKFIQEKYKSVIDQTYAAL